MATKETKEKSVFDVLNAIDCSAHVEKKNGLTYLSWSWAWQIVKKNYPDASYKKTYWDGKPYLYDPALGYYVETEVTIQGETLGMNLFVMDGANKAMKAEPYTYKATKWENGQRTEITKTVPAATMFDINTALMRCLVKNLAMFGLGLYIYAGEDIPEEVKLEREENTKKQQEQLLQQRIQTAISEVGNCNTSAEVKTVYNKYRDLAAVPQFKDMVIRTGNDLKAKEDGKISA